MQKNTAQERYGFTLVELLIVIAIIGILAAVVTLVINPIELQKRGRDANRLSDLASLQQAINAAAVDATGSTAADILCAGTTAPCSGNSAEGTQNSVRRAIDGTGWVKVNLTNQSVKFPLLPLDPLNSGTNIYEYASDGTDWEISTILESTQYASKMVDDVPSASGGDDTKYEVGTKYSLVGAPAPTATPTPTTAP